jgi:hypothetical protein
MRRWTADSLSSQWSDQRGSSALEFLWDPGLLRERFLKDGFVSSTASTRLGVHRSSESNDSNKDEEAASNLESLHVRPWKIDPPRQA